MPDEQPPHEVALIEAIKFHEKIVDEWEWEARCHRFTDLPDNDEKSKWMPPDNYSEEFHADRSRWLKELQNHRNSVPRTKELLDSTMARCNQLQDDVRKLKEEKAALADVIADLQMDRKARE